MSRTSPYDALRIALVLVLIGLAMVFGAQRGRRAVYVAARGRDVTELIGAGGRFTLFPMSGRVECVSADSRSQFEVELSMLVDNVERPVAMRKSDVTKRGKSQLVAAFPVDNADDRAAATLELRLDPASDQLTVSLAVLDEPGAPTHTYALRAGVAPDRRTVFAPGVGELPEETAVEARSVVLLDAAHPLAIVSPAGLSLVQASPAIESSGATARLNATAKAESSRPRAATPRSNRSELSLVLGTSSESVWGRIFHATRVPAAHVHGIVTGTKDRAHVVASDDQATPQLYVNADAAGGFSVEAPKAATLWYAALDQAQVSTPVRFAPGPNVELKLDVSPGGEVRVVVTDGDTGKPLLARVIVRGIDGTLDPNFGPDYRASGAGPLMDVVHGEASNPLAVGRYRVSATKGLEWTIDAEVVDITSGRMKQVALELRHAVPTPTWVGCDLHVHARPSFDSPVLPEDRVISLLSAGVDFAVPTEHNVVGDYTQSLEILDLTGQLASVPGVEVTTFTPRFGHFGVFPYPATAPVPPYRGSSLDGVFAAARRGDSTRILQVNHPRLPAGIGYFNLVGFDPKSGKIPPGMRTDFDLLEVYNGFDLPTRPRVEQALQDWFALLNLGKRIFAAGSSDSHRIQYQWAGYPRTYAAVESKAAGDTGLPVDAAAVVAALKRGGSFVTSGPILEFQLEHDGRVAKVGDEIARGEKLGGHVRVRAAPWVDVTHVEILAGVPPSQGDNEGVIRTLWADEISTLPSRVGKEIGSIEQIATSTLRLDTDVDLNVPEGATWVVLVVKGDRSLDDVLPFMSAQPMGFTNPIWLR